MSETDHSFPSSHEEPETQLLSGQDTEQMPTLARPRQLLTLEQAGCSDVGTRRRYNEDYFGMESHLIHQQTPQAFTVNSQGLYIVCDGMGGHAAGDVASAMAVETLQEYFQTHWQQPQLPDEDTIRKGILGTNEKIYQINQQHSRSGSGRMGTTLVMALVQNTEVAIAHVGDSRAYQLNRDGEIWQLTVDHEVGQREIQKGVSVEQAYGSANAYRLTQALGPRSNHYVDPEIQYFTIQEDTLLLLCSDGLSDGNLLKQYGTTYLVPLLQSGAQLHNGLLELIEFGDKTHGHDNLTAVLVKLLVGQS